MSRTRKIKPKRIIQKPEPKKIKKKKPKNIIQKAGAKKINIELNESTGYQSEILSKTTLIDDVETFKWILNETVKTVVGKGIIGSSKEVGESVDFKLSERVGFKKNKSGSLDIVTTKYTTKKDKKLLEEIENNYKISKIKDVLESEGYTIEEKQGDNEDKEIIAKQEKDGEERIIEITTEKFEDKDKKNDDYSDDIVTIHSVNFEDEKECTEAVDLLEHAFSGKIIEDRDTGEYSKKTKENRKQRQDKNRRRERSGKKEEKNKIVSRSSRERKNKHRR
jgi:hypothetical protein